jgi:hypothetical protein
MEIQIVVPDKQAAKNFSEWFRKEGFDAFTKSKHNDLKKHGDSYITCLATDERLSNSRDNSYEGQFFEIQ